MHSASYHMDAVLVCVGSRTVRCMRYFIAHFLSCTDRCFLPCLLSFFYSRIIVIIHSLNFPLDWIVSLISAYLSLVSLFLFSRLHRFPRSFIRSVSSMRSRIAAWYDIDGLYCNDGKVALSSSSSYSFAP